MVVSFAHFVHEHLMHLDVAILGATALTVAVRFFIGE